MEDKLDWKDCKMAVANKTKNDLIMSFRVENGKKILCISEPEDTSIEGDIIFSNSVTMMFNKGKLDEENK